MRFILTAFVLCLMSLPSLSQPAVKDAFIPIRGYFLRNDANLGPADVNYLVMKDKDEFYRFFGVGRTMGGFQEIDFSMPVFAIALAPTDSNTEITVKSVSLEGSVLTVRFAVTVGEKMSYTMTPVLIFQAGHGISEAVFSQNGASSDKVYVK